MSAAPVTVVISRVVKPGREEPFEREVQAFIPKALQFEGHQGAFILRPPPGRREYGAVLRFHSEETWEAFRDSDVYQAFVARIREHLEEDQRVEAATGLEGWFAAPGRQFVEAPPRWKAALVTWVGVAPTALALTFVFNRLLPDWPWVARNLVFGATMVVILTWVVMPPLSAWMRRIGFLGGR
jgi:antibiotic biosynthesis monooxygenase (ABM) superfamily enzyme